ncbi:MAG: GNAT family N-acetyltransferase [Cytophagaceae bacterium]|nr:GNAT family N-acetyltransferase [Cytophagaceae bacterium]
MCSKNNSSPSIIREGFIETISFSVPLFFRPSFVYRKGSDSIWSFQLQQNDSDAQALIYFFLDDQEAMSIPASPFGSMYGNENCTTEILTDFVTDIKRSLIQKGIQSIGIKHYPACYAPDLHDKVVQAFISNGFKINCTEHNQYLPLSAASKKEVFDHSKLHLIKKCKEANFTVSISSSFNADAWYDIITRARALRGHPMTIDLESLRVLNVGNENAYHFFEVKDGSKIIACAIGVQVTEEVLYYYLAADEDEYRSYSPMTFLFDRMYDFACEKNVKVLDMGISSSKGILNEGLRWFKKSFGAIEQPKLILQYQVGVEEEEAANGK